MNSFWIKSIVGISLLFFVLSFSCTHNMKLPSGWREPTNDEIRDSWRNDNTNKYSIVRGDFNGDGLIDEAKLLVSEDGSRVGLFAFMCQADNTVKVYVLDELQGAIYIHAMGVKKVTAGAYKTACGKGYWACSKDELPEIVLQHDAIDYFKVESTNSYFYWDAPSKGFRRIWISD